MRQVRKREGKMIKAYCLGEDHPMIERLIGEGKIRQVDAGHWRVFSQEAEKGELAESGDYVKLDSSGAPYPNTREFFKKNHRHVDGDDYEQIPKWLNAWCLEDGICPEIHFLIEHKGLVINEENEDACFRAPLWGDMLTAARNAVIVFFELEYDAGGEIVEADFNFVAKDEFDKVYLSE